jgi:hypothetical protein
MDEINLGFDNDNKKKISLGVGESGSSNINIKEDDSLGVELLTNKPTRPSGEYKTTSDNGYSSGEESSKKEKTSNDEYGFFNDDLPGDFENDLKPENKESPIDDPMLNNIKANDNGGFKTIHSMNAQEIKNEKIDLIYKFKKLEGQGIRTTMNYNMNSHLEDMRNEYLKLKKQREVDNSVKFQRKVMMAAITGIEYLNGKFDPFDVKLDGWSESINENIYDYDEVFEELSEKYGGQSEMAPELKLMMMLGGSAFMFHLSNTMFKSSIPGMDDIMKQNPELMKQFAKAAVGSIGKTNQPQQNNYQPQPQQNQGRQPVRQPRAKKTIDPRIDMDGPDGLDNIISQMNIQPGDIPDLDNISIMSGDTDRRSSSGITMNI